MHQQPLLWHTPCHQHNFGTMFWYLTAWGIAAILLTLPHTGMAARKDRQTGATNASRHTPVQRTPPTTVYRCGTTYQATACENTALATQQQVIRTVDSRTADQIRAAYQAHQRLTKQAKAIEQAQRKQLRALQQQPLRAVGLSCHAPGTRPFETCQETGKKGKTSGESALPRKQAKSPQRQGPYVANVSDKAPG